jgi:hypothetical protein
VQADSTTDFARAVLRALRASTVTCTYCGSSHIRPSRRMYGFVPSFLALRAWRCLDCGRRFPLRAGVTRVRSWTPPGDAEDAPFEMSRPPGTSARSAERARRRRRMILVRAGYAAVLIVVLLVAVFAWRPVVGGGGGGGRKWKPPAGARPWRQ